jgi:hypothetical protein
MLSNGPIQLIDNVYILCVYVYILLHITLQRIKQPTGIRVGFRWQLYSVTQRPCLHNLFEFKLLSTRLSYKVMGTGLGRGQSLSHLGVALRRRRETDQSSPVCKVHSHPAAPACDEADGPDPILASALLGAKDGGWLTQ